MAVDGQVPPDEGLGSEEGGGQGGRSGIIIPRDVRAMLGRNQHTSDRMRELGVMYFFHKKQAKKKRDDERRSREVERLRRLEEEKLAQERMFPPTSFIESDSGGADVRGTLVIPSRNSVTVAVYGYLLAVEPDGTHALLVLRPQGKAIDCSYLVALCNIAYLPEDLVSKAGKRHSKTEWEESIEFEACKVRRGSQEMHLVTKGPFSNRTCDDAMAESLRNGFVMASRGNGSGRLVYAACRQRFVKGNQLPSSKAFIVVVESGVMYLQHSPCSSQSVSARILACGRCARNGLLVTKGSFKAALSLMEGFSNSAKEQESEHHSCINVALGGSPTLGEYGKVVPCSVLARRHPFPSGSSFAATPSSCGVEVLEHPPDNESAQALLSAIRKMNGNTTKAGHSYVSSKK